MRSSKSCSLPKKDWSLQSTFKCFVCSCYSTSDDEASSTSPQSSFLRWMYFIVRNLFTLWCMARTTPSFLLLFLTSSPHPIHRSFSPVPFLFKHNSAKELAFYPNTWPNPTSWTSFFPLQSFPQAEPRQLPSSSLPVCQHFLLLSRLGHWSVAASIISSAYFPAYPTNPSSCPEQSVCTPCCFGDTPAGRSSFLVSSTLAILHTNFFQ